MAAEPELAAPAPPRRPVRRLTKEARREQLLDTAANLLLSGGIDALTMEGIGQEAGASKTLGYAYFTNVDHVVVTLRERELRHLYQRVEEAADAAERFDDRLGAAFGAYFDIVAERGLLLAELEQAMSARRIRTGRSDGTVDFLGWLAALIDAEFEVGERRARSYAAIVAGVANLHAGIWQRSRFSRHHIEATALAFALGGLRAAVERDTHPT